MLQLYTLDNDGNAVPASWAEYGEWHSRLPDEDRMGIGKLLRKETIGANTIITIFLGAPIGYFHRSPQLWVSLTLGPGKLIEQVYSSTRAALQGHGRTARQLRRSSVAANFAKVA